MALAWRSSVASKRSRAPALPSAGPPPAGLFRGVPKRDVASGAGASPRSTNVPRVVNRDAPLRLRAESWTFGSSSAAIAATPSSTPGPKWVAPPGHSLHRWPPSSTSGRPAHTADCALTLGAPDLFKDTNGRYVPFLRIATPEPAPRRRPPRRLSLTHPGRPPAARDSRWRRLSSRSLRRRDRTPNSVFREKVAQSRQRARGSCPSPRLWSAVARLTLGCSACSFKIQCLGAAVRIVLEGNRAKSDSAASRLTAEPPVPTRAIHVCGVSPGFGPAHRSKPAGPSHHPGRFASPG
jgi:hypothetical protein